MLYGSDRELNYRNWVKFLFGAAQKKKGNGEFAIKICQSQFSLGYILLRIE